MYCTPVPRYQLSEETSQNILNVEYTLYSGKVTIKQTQRGLQLSTSYPGNTSLKGTL